MKTSENKKIFSIAAVLFLATSVIALYSQITILLTILYYISIASFGYIILTTKKLTSNSSTNAFLDTFSLDAEPPSLASITTKKNELVAPYEHIIKLTSFMRIFAISCTVFAIIAFAKNYPSTNSFIPASVFVFMFYIYIFNYMKLALEVHLFNFQFSLSEASDESFDGVFSALCALQHANSRAMVLLTYVDRVLSSGRKLTNVELDLLVNSCGIKNKLLTF